jgi:hypothetical protein
MVVMPFGKTVCHGHADAYPSPQSSLLAVKNSSGVCNSLESEGLALTSWVTHELLAARFHNLRLAEHLLGIVERFAERPEESIPQICDSQAETQAGYRFFDNSAVTVDAIPQPHLVRPNAQGNLPAINDGLPINTPTF